MFHRCERRLTTSGSLTAFVLFILAAAAAAVPASPRALPAQTPRVTPPPPCRAGTAIALRPAGRTGDSNSGTFAVMMFESRVTDPSDAHLAWALSTQIAKRLDATPGATVETRGTVERAWAESGARTDRLLEILGDRFAITGDVIPQRDRIDVTVHLTESGKPTPMWTKTFAYPRTSVRVIEDEVIAAARDAAKLRRLAAEKPVVSGGAYDLLLRGDYLFSHHSPGAADSARRAFQQSAELDPKFALAIARAARARAAFLDRSSRTNGRVVDEYVLAGMALADRALALDSSLAEAWTARAILLRYRDPQAYAGVVQAHERAIKFAPNSADAHHAYGYSLLRLGRDDVAEQHFKRALAIEPNRANTLRAMGELAYTRRRLGDACALVNASIGADSYDPFAYAARARIRMGLSEFRDAFSDAETADRLSEADWGQALRLLVTARTSNVDAARVDARRIATDKLRPGATLSIREATYLSMALDALGERSKALDALSRTRPLGVELNAMLRDPGFDPMRSDPRFRRITVGGTSSASGQQGSVNRLVGTVPP